MQQFTILSIALIIATIFCSFSIINGFYKQISDPVVGYYGNVFATNNVEAYTANPENNILKIATELNSGFERFPINNLNNDSEIKNISFIRVQKTSAAINSEYKNIDAIEDVNQKEDISVSPELVEHFLNPRVTVFDVNTTTIMGPRYKVYQNYSVRKEKGYGNVVYFSSQEYRKLFRNDRYNLIKISTKNLDPSPALLNELQTKYGQHNIYFKSWDKIDKGRAYVVKLLNLQKKIFYLIYALLFLLLGIIIVLTNVIFFKEKRKDWALYKMLKVLPYSVERIFFYKNFISYLISLGLGLFIGFLLSLYCNEIIQFVSFIMGVSSTKVLIFGFDKLTYDFSSSDIVIIAVVSFILFFSNFVALLFIFRKEKGASFLKAA